MATKTVISEKVSNRIDGIMATLIVSIAVVFSFCATANATDEPLSNGMTTNAVAETVTVSGTAGFTVGGSAGITLND